MRKSTKLLLLTIALFASLSACTKGQKGDTGPAGQNGANGANGTNGADGNANVHAGSVTINTNNWVWDDNVKGNHAGITYNAITQDVVNYGAVMVYYSNGNGGWVALPYTDYATTTVSFSYDFAYYQGGVTIWLYLSDFSNSLPSGAITFKVVAISGQQKRANPNANWKDYNQVMKITEAK